MNGIETILSGAKPPSGLIQPKPRPLNPYGCVGRLTEDAVKLIRIQAIVIPISLLSIYHNLPPQTIRDVLKGRTYKNIGAKYE